MIKRMTSTRRYLLKAIYDWILDNDCTPYVMVDAERPGVVVPQEYIEDGHIVLNLAPAAVKEFAIEPQSVSFLGRFSGRTVEVFVPIMAIEAIYAAENGKGMAFKEEDLEDEGAPPPDKKGKPQLRVVK